MSTRPGLRIWLIAFTGFFLLHAGWAYAAPFDGPADEAAHAERAADVNLGRLLPNAAGNDYVPRSIVRPRCFEQNIGIPANCVEQPGGDSALVLVDNYVAYYNPVYYWVTGWPVAIWPDWTGILLARLLTGAVMAGLLAAAVVAACRWSRHRALLGGLVVAATPMLVSLGGAINPNGVEIAAGVALFAGLIPLLLEPRESLNRGAVTLVGISASILVTPRALGPLWLGLDLGAVLIGCSWTQLRALARERVVRIWAGVVGLSLLAALAWDVVGDPLSTVIRDPQHLTFSEIIRAAVIDMWANDANQMIGVTGWSELLQPRLVYVAWFTAAGILVLGGFVFGNRKDRLRMGGLFVGTFIPLLGYELVTANEGWFNQGRYFLPGAVGVPLLGAHVLARRLGAADLRSLTRTLAVLLLPIQFVVLAYTMCRWQSGLQLLNPLKGSWLPPLGPVLPLALGAAGVVVLCFVFWRSAGAVSTAGDLQHSSEETPEMLPSLSAGSSRG